MKKEKFIPVLENAKNFDFAYVHLEEDALPFWWKSFCNGQTIPIGSHIGSRCHDLRNYCDIAEPLLIELKTGEVFSHYDIDGTIG